MSARFPKHPRVKLRQTPLQNYVGKFWIVMAGEVRAADARAICKFSIYNFAVC